MLSKIALEAKAKATSKRSCFLFAIQIQNFNYSILIYLLRKNRLALDKLKLQGSSLEES